MMIPKKDSASENMTCHFCAWLVMEGDAKWSFKGHGESFCSLNCLERSLTVPLASAIPDFTDFVEELPEAT